MSPVGLAVSFRTGANAGYITPVVVTTPFAGGTTVVVELRVWEARFGVTYEAAVAAGGYYGKIPPLRLTVAVAPNTPSDMVGLQSFQLIPEPSPLALGLLGATAMGLRRRRH